ncbi:hypothetical protein H0194_04700 [Corynebacterium incognita]|uniref:Uncharacterized protein n=1 Tax=Corynebacterium incognita TaxID=2754725 RepID=A0A7G7CRR4_9CORY|nr:hypothetical protein [Corynebacterium incognita]QNE90280.1 hypothetical protein H0194_04700 [Corynebacterium incognita]
MNQFEKAQHTMNETNIVFKKDDVTINGQSVICLENAGIQPCGDHVAVTLTIIGNLQIEGLPKGANIIDPQDIWDTLKEQQNA